MKIYTSDRHNSYSLRFKLPLILPLILLFLSCKTSLAPAFNKDIVDEIFQTNKETLEFLSSMDSGTSYKSFIQRQDTYDKLIGSFESVEALINARPVPSGKVKGKVNAMLTKKGVPIIANSDYPSLMAIKEVVKNIRKMKELDLSNSLNKSSIEIFKNAITISIDQALTYEYFLNR
jgi:hypothetical protein